MESSFRIALGSGKCDGIHAKRQHVLLGMCAEIKQHLDSLRLLSREQLEALPEDEVDTRAVRRKSVTLTTNRVGMDDGGILIVVQGYVATLLFPTFISASRIGHVIAEGFIVDASGTLSDAPDELMWPFR